MKGIYILINVYIVDNIFRQIQIAENLMFWRPETYLKGDYQYKFFA